MRCLSLWVSSLQSCSTLLITCLRLQSWQPVRAFRPALYLLPFPLCSWQREIVLCCTFRWQLTGPGTCRPSGRGRSKINADCQPDSLIVAHVASQVIRSLKMIKTRQWESYCLGQFEARTRLNKPLMGIRVEVEVWPEYNMICMEEDIERRRLGKLLLG